MYLLASSFILSCPGLNEKLYSHSVLKTAMLFLHFQITGKDKYLPNCLYEASISLIPI